MRAARLPAIVSQILVSRGVYDAEHATMFLDNRWSGLRDPNLLPGVVQATPLIVDAIRNQTPIVIYGDYDADGMTASAILVNGIKLLGGNVSYFVPNRLDEGYGLNEDAIRKLAERGKRMIISVDCGITSIAHAELCRELDVALIITDHHNFSDTLPDATAIIHPRLPGTTYPFGELCGAGVAFKLAWALCQEMCGSTKVTEPLRRYLMQSLSLAAIGTIADVVPLLDENRIIVQHGLRMLAAEPLPGLAELMQLSGVVTNGPITTESIAFALAPRLNAAGRLGQAQLAVELLTSPKSDRITALADYINQLNSSRDNLQRSVYLAAQKQVKTEFDPEVDPALVLAGVGWHPGVIGVVAGRLSEKYAKPVIVISLDSAGKSPAVGSGRVGGVDINLYEALSECSERLVRFGGHHAAAGLTIEERQIDAFRGDFCEVIARQWADREVVPEIVIDAESPLGMLTLPTLEQLEMLAPFGAGNPRPVLCCRNVTLAEPARRMGGGDRHLSVRLKQGSSLIRGVAFSCGDWCDELNACETPIEIAYRPVINDYNGFKRVEIHVVDWRPSGHESLEATVGVPANVSADETESLPPF
jgi:single-stranded-DNA-specific exonuclease